MASAQDQPGVQPKELQEKQSCQDKFAISAIREAVDLFGSFEDVTTGQYVERIPQMWREQSIQARDNMIARVFSVSGIPWEDGAEQIDQFTRQRDKVRDSLKRAISNRRSYRNKKHKCQKSGDETCTRKTTFVPDSHQSHDQNAPRIPPASSWSDTFTRICNSIGGETDLIVAMAMVSAEVMHMGSGRFSWVGFYRWRPNKQWTEGGTEQKGVLLLGPHQGNNSTLRVASNSGVCGKAATTLQTQFVDDVTKLTEEEGFRNSERANTRSKVASPVVGKDGMLLGVLNLESDLAGAFNTRDVSYCMKITKMLGEGNWETGTL